MYNLVQTVYDAYMTTSTTNEVYEDLIENHGLEQLPKGYRYNIWEGAYGTVYFELQKMRKYEWMGWRTILENTADSWEDLNKKAHVVRKLNALYTKHFIPPVKPKRFIDDFLGTMP